MNIDKYEIKFTFCEKCKNNDWWKVFSAVNCECWQHDPLLVAGCGAGPGLLLGLELSGKKPHCCKKVAT